MPARTVFNLVFIPLLSCLPPSQSAARKAVRTGLRGRSGAVFSLSSSWPRQALRQQNEQLARLASTQGAEVRYDGPGRVRKSVQGGWLGCGNVNGRVWLIECHIYIKKKRWFFSPRRILLLFLLVVFDIAGIFKVVIATQSSLPVSITAISRCPPRIFNSG